MTDTAEARAAEWFAMPELTGQLVRLRPLRAEDAAGYLAATGGPSDSEEVFRWLNTAGSTSGAPRDLADATADVATALLARARGHRLPYAQIAADSGEFIGTTSYYDAEPAARSLAIGYTWLGRRSWRRGANTEAKLLLLGHAFDTLGAVRVVWHTDIRNERSQAAIARLGATREGELRKHRLRRDGSWRTTVQFSMTDEDWPAARVALQARLGRG